MTIFKPIYLNLNDSKEKSFLRKLHCFHNEMIYLYIRIQTPLPVFTTHIPHFSLITGKDMEVWHSKDTSDNKTIKTERLKTSRSALLPALGERTESSAGS